MIIPPEPPPGWDLAAATAALDARHDWMTAQLKRLFRRHIAAILVVTVVAVTAQLAMGTTLADWQAYAVFVAQWAAYGVVHRYYARARDLDRLRVTWNAAHPAEGRLCAIGDAGVELLDMEARWARVEQEEST